MSLKAVLIQGMGVGMCGCGAVGHSWAVGDGPFGSMTQQLLPSSTFQSIRGAEWKSLTS